MYDHVWMMYLTQAWQFSYVFLLPGRICSPAFPCVPLRSRQVLSGLRDHLGGKGRIHLKAAAASVAVLKSPREKD